MKTFRKLTLLCSVAVLLGSAAPLVAAEQEKTLSAAEQGKKVAFDRDKGNCLACHMIAGGESPGNIGPPLVGMSARFPDKAKLRAQIFDATANNPNTMMPPFGKHHILSAEEIDNIVEFIYSH